MFGRMAQGSRGWVLAYVLGCLLVGIAGCEAAGDPRFGEKVMAGIDDMPSVAALRTHYPDDYKTLQARVRNLRQHNSLEDASRAVGDVMSEVGAREYPKADAESVYGLYAVIRAYAAALQPVDPRGCVDMLEGKAAPASLAKITTRAMDEADMAATVQLLTQAATRPAPPAEPMSLRDFAEFAYPALATLPEEDQEVALEVLRQGRDPASTVEERIMCAYGLAVADRYLALPPAEGGELIRKYNAMAESLR